MTPVEHARVMELLQVSLERNINAKLTPELASGILTLVNVEVQPMVREPKPSRKKRATSSDSK